MRICGVIGFIAYRGTHVQLREQLREALLPALPVASYQDHQLAGEFVGYRECHIRPDLLLIYRIENNNLILVLAGLGSHPELFGG